jgi:hypothetical protein
MYNKDMSFPAHLLSSSFLAVAAAGVKPGETAYILAAMASASFPDFDHLFYFVRDWDFYRQNGIKGSLQGALHKARSFLHELLGVLILGIILLGLFLVNQKLATVVFVAYLLHVSQDILTGISLPFNPVEKTEVKFFSLTLIRRAYLDLATIFLFGLLWIRFLSD